MNRNHRLQAVLLTGASCFSGLALSAPTYLECFVSDSSARRDFTVTLDESRGTASHKSETGAGFNAQAIFSANTVVYQNTDVASGIRMTFRYEIDRTTLELSLLFTAAPVDPSTEAVIGTRRVESLGRCSLAPVPERKF